MLLAPSKSRIGRYVRARPELLRLPYVNFISVNWSVPTRIRRARSHIETTAGIGGIFRASPSEVAVLIELAMIDTNYRVCLHQARWLFREGQHVLSLYDGKDIIFSLAFSLCTEGGRRIAFIGGIQGRPQLSGEINILDRYRRFTKAAFGLRPRDLLVEIAKLFFSSIGVVEILAVSDSAHVQRSLTRRFAVSYDEIWQERGGTPNGDGFYVLPLGRAVKAIEDVPSKKRSLYRKRSELLMQVEAALQCSLSLKEQRTFSSIDGNVIEGQEIDGHADPYKILAYTSAVFVLSVTHLFGGTWLGVSIGLVFVYVTHQILKQTYLRRIAHPLQAINLVRLFPIRYRIGASATVMVLVLAIDVRFGGSYELGRAFKVYLIPIFISSIILGGRGTLAMLICCLAAIDFLHLPPKYSFSLSGVTDAVDLLVYCALACTAFVIPRLLMVSIELAQNPEWADEPPISMRSA